MDCPVIRPATSALTVKDLVDDLHLWNSDLSLDLLVHVELLLDDLWYVHHSFDVLRLSAALESASESQWRCRQPDLEHLLQNRSCRRQFLRTLTLGVQLFHGVLKRLHVLNPRVQIIASVYSSTLPRSSLSRRRSGRSSPGGADVSEDGSRPGIQRSTRCNASSCRSLG